MLTCYIAAYISLLLDGGQDHLPTAGYSHRLVSGTVGFLMESNMDESHFRIMLLSPALCKATNHELGQHRVAQVRLLFEFTRGSK